MVEIASWQQQCLEGMCSFGLRLFSTDLGQQLQR